MQAKIRLWSLNSEQQGAILIPGTETDTPLESELWTAWQPLFRFRNRIKMGIGSHTHSTLQVANWKEKQNKQFFRDGKGKQRSIRTAMLLYNYCSIQLQSRSIYNLMFYTVLLSDHAANIFMRETKRTFFEQKVKGNVQNLDQWRSSWVISLQFIRTS